MCVSVLPVCVHLQHVETEGLQRLEESTWSPGSGITVSCEPTHFGNPIWVSSAKKSVLNNLIISPVP